jgi:hypothetical protein
MERLGYGVERHADHFGPDEQDDSAWLTLAGKRGWAVLSADNRDRYADIERRAITEHSVRYFAFRANNVSGPQKAALLRKHDSKIRRILELEEPPYIARITKETVRIVFRP